MPTGPEAYRQLKELRPVFDHKLNVVWTTELGLKVCQLLDFQGVLWTSIDVVCFIKVGEGEAVGPIVLWIGVAAESLLGEDAHTSANGCLDFLKEFGIIDVEVEFRETIYTPLAGPNLLVDAAPSFEYPDDRLLPLWDLISEDLMRKPDMLDHDGESCLLVIKNGNATGVTIGRATGIFSYVCKYFSNNTHQISMEWAILPYDNKSGAFAAPGDSGSIIADGRGRVGGILTSGAGKTTSSDITYATPFFWLLPSIKQNGVRRLGIPSILFAFSGLIGPPISGALLTDRNIWYRGAVFNGVSDRPNRRAGGPPRSPTAVKRYKPSTKDPLPRIKLTLPRDPDRIYYYGWPITDAWLNEFLRQELLPEDYAIEAANPFHTINAMSCLEFCCKIRNLRLRPARNPGNVPEDCLFDPESVRVLSICSDEEDQLRAKPTQEQVDYLARLLGKEDEPPTWWSDPHTLWYFDEQWLASGLAV
ncbi:hypothetical protein PAXINDRAFT_99664 [Paxillus involutus ATCC 200175]|uniref:Uncharacterized protein n=1 Tax=Paxillus involutus ATCC 200175 TaxID=664439 RepID=A0A0C9THK3_PAXIN|nr:hypothetical protein PAXINDRAFT_99664 [Paxillus involutus ATCC 200175]